MWILKDMNEQVDHSQHGEVKDEPTTNEHSSEYIGDVYWVHYQAGEDTFASIFRVDIMISLADSAALFALNINWSW